MADNKGVKTKELNGMSLDDFYEMMQIAIDKDENGNEILIDLRYL